MKDSLYLLQQFFITTRLADTSVKVPQQYSSFKILSGIMSHDLKVKMALKIFFINILTALRLNDSPLDISLIIRKYIIFIVCENMDKKFTKTSVRI